MNEIEPDFQEMSHTSLKIAAGASIGNAPTDIDVAFPLPLNGMSLVSLSPTSNPFPTRVWLLPSATPIPMMGELLCPG